MQLWDISRRRRDPLLGIMYALWGSFGQKTIQYMHLGIIRVYL